jgi:hypothetical protein
MKEKELTDMQQRAQEYHRLPTDYQRYQVKP